MGGTSCYSRPQTYYQSGEAVSEFEILALITIGVIVCLLNWRTGIYVCLIAGFLQDTFRKLVPGEPVYFTVLVGLFVMATCLSAYKRGVRLSPRHIHAWNNVLRRPLALFVLLVLIQSLVALIKTGNPVIAGIGLLAYLTPLPAILLGYRFGKNEREILKFAKVYLVVSFLMVTGIYLSYAGYDWTALRSVGAGLIAYSPSGEKLTLYSGFLRSPEIAAWHAATAMCMIFLLLLVRRRQGIFLWTAGALILFLAGALMLTGRRKFLVEIFLFLSVYVLLLMWFRKGAVKSTLVLSIVITTAFIAFVYLSPPEVNKGLGSYYERSASVQKDVSERMSVMTVQSFQYVIAQNGVLGSGAGTGSQGAQHYGGGSEIVGLAAEGGLAKVLAELGIPGLLLLLWLGVSLVRYVWSILVYIKDKNQLHAKLTYGLLAFLVSNAFVYIVAHQVFGDVFVLLILGFHLGFIMAVPRMQKAEALAPPFNAIYSQQQIIERPLPGVAGGQGSQV
jgi:hypothetical protein